MKLTELPKKTSVWCHWCCHSFKTPPLALPFMYKDNTYYVEGNFCSWECMKSYNNDKNDSLKNHRYSLLTQMYKDVYKKIEPISFAPSKLDLKVFGGKLSIDEFRNNIKQVQSYKFPIIFINPSHENTSNFSWAINQKPETTTATSELKLKRKGPKKSMYNTLESTMGIGIN